MSIVYPHTAALEISSFSHSSQCMRYSRFSVHRGAWGSIFFAYHHKRATSFLQETGGKVDQIFPQIFEDDWCLPADADMLAQLNTLINITSPEAQTQASVILVDTEFHAFANSNPSVFEIAARLHKGKKITNTFVSYPGITFDSLPIHPTWIRASWIYTPIMAWICSAKHRE